MGRKISFEIKEKIAVVTMNRPEKQNAFDESMFSALETVTEELKTKLPRAVVLTGAGDKAFSAGFDVNPENTLVKDVMEGFEKDGRKAAGKLVSRIRKAVDGFISLPVPIIAAINGLAYGGGMEFAARCDIRVMDETAALCFSEVKLGLMPDWGGAPYLTKLVGSGAASELILTARKIYAEEAFKMGLVNRVAEKGKSLEKALSIAGQIAENGPNAVRSALSVIRQSSELSLKEALDLEKETASDLIASGECIHGIMAFMEKKNPKFPD